MNGLTNKLWRSQKLKGGGPNKVPAMLNANTLFKAGLVNHVRDILSLTLKRIERHIKASYAHSGYSVNIC